MSYFSFESFASHIFRSLCSGKSWRARSYFFRLFLVVRSFASPCRLVFVIFPYRYFFTLISLRKNAPASSVSEYSSRNRLELFDDRLGFWHSYFIEDSVADLPALEFATGNSFFFIKDCTFPDSYSYEYPV